MGGQLTALRVPAPIDEQAERNHPLYYDWTVPKWQPFKLDRPVGETGSQSLKVNSKSIGEENKNSNSAHTSGSKDLKQNLSALNEPNSNSSEQVVSTANKESVNKKLPLVGGSRKSATMGKQSGLKSVKGGNGLNSNLETAVAQKHAANIHSSKSS